MKYTGNYNLKKPDGTDAVNIDDLNSNADIIDTEIKKINTNKVDKVTGKQLSTEDYTTTEKAKLAGIAANANNYSHPTGDGNLHVPATGTTNNGKVLKAGATTGSAGWGTLTKSDVGLSNVDNTSDANKPVSTAQATVNQNLQNQITANKKGENVNITEITRVLYGLSAGDANVDKALQKNMQGGILNAILTGFTHTGDYGNVVPTDRLSTALNRIINNINNLKVVTGTFTGIYAQPVTVNLGFTPSFVIYFGVLSGSYPSIMFLTPQNTFYARTGQFLVYDIVYIVENGFITRNDVGDKPYYYVAFR